MEDIKFRMKWNVSSEMLLECGLYNHLFLLFRYKMYVDSSVVVKTGLAKTNSKTAGEITESLKNIIIL